MPVFFYQALEANGALLSGERAAVSVEELKSELSSQGLLVQHVRRKQAGFRGLRAPRIRPDDILLFNQELIALFRAGLTVPEALRISAERPEQPLLAGIVRRVLEDVQKGMKLSEACAQHPDVFDRMYVSSLSTGESVGDLVGVLERYQRHLEQRIHINRKISQALTYPAFLLVTMAVILAILFIFVMPRFAAMYQDFSAELPAATQVLMSVAGNLHIVLGVLSVCGAGLWVFWRAQQADPEGRRRIDSFKERLPMIGSLVRIHSVAQFCRTLSTLLASGMPLVPSLHTTTDALGNRAYAARLEQGIGEVSGGAGLAATLSRLGLLPLTAIKLVEVGELSGNLEAMLAEAAAYFEDTLELRLERVVSLVEPLLMLLVGVLIGGVIIVMYLPIFNMADIIQ